MGEKFRGKIGDKLGKELGQDLGQGLGRELGEEFGAAIGAAVRDISRCRKLIRNIKETVSQKAVKTRFGGEPFHLMGKGRSDRRWE